MLKVESTIIVLLGLYLLVKKNKIEELIHEKKLSYQSMNCVYSGFVGPLIGGAMMETIGFEWGTTVIAAMFLATVS